MERLDDTALRRTDKFDELVALGARGYRLLGLVAGVHVVHATLEEDAAGVVDRLDLLIAEAATRQTHLVQTGITSRICVAHDDEGGHILRNAGHALDHGVVAHRAPLVDGCVAADDYPVADGHLAGQRYAVGNDAVAAHHVVVSHVYVGHQQVVVAHDGLTLRGRTAADRHTLADVVVVADLGRRSLTGKLQILGQTRNRGCRMDLATLADAGTVMDHCTRADPTIITNDHVACDVGKGLYGNIFAQLGVGVYKC